MTTCKTCGAPLAPDAELCIACTRPSPDVERAPMDMDAYLRLFVGAKYAVYRKKWEKMRDWGGAASWNWAGFFFFTSWLAYRRMFREALLCVAAGGVAAIADQVLGISNLISSLTTLGICITVGLLGNSWYRRDAEARIHAIVATKDKDDVPGEIVRQGRTDFVAAIGFFLLDAAVAGTIGIVADFLS